jgi:hypothetical protein
MACHEVHVKPGGKSNDLGQVAISRIGKDMCNKINFCAIKLFILLLELQTFVP